MNQIELAVFWALTLIGSALASRFGLFASGVADGLFFGLLMGAGFSLAQSARPENCSRELLT